MKIYFAGSIRGAPSDREWIHALIRHLSRYGRVLTEHSFQYSTEDENKFNDKWIYSTDIQWIKEADVLVAEVSSPSLGVGYELRFAEELEKSVLCLYRKQEGKKLSAMLLGNSYFTIKEYEDKAEAFEFIDDFFRKMKN